MKMGMDPMTPCTWDFGLDVEIAQVDYLNAGLLISKW
jgi:hypothetical protein